MIHKKWRAVLWRWHRRLGITFLIFIIWLSASGILLNHTDDLGLAEQPVHQQFLLSLYGIERPAIHSYQIAGQWISHSGEHLYRNSTQITHCAGTFSGIALAPATDGSPNIIAAACGDEIALFTAQGELVERINASYALPRPLQSLGQCETAKQEICFSANNRSFMLNVNDVVWAESTQNINPSATSQLPSNLQKALEQSALSLDWEKVILDLHAGRLFGLGPWLMDIVGVLFIVLGLSGLGIWLFHKRL